jgi:spore coat polysaccharide biosynthesis protein SpsF
MDKSETSITVIIQARVGSTRLPNKVLKDLCGKPVLWHVVNRLKQSKLISEIVIATTILPEDDAIQQFCEENNIKYYRGSSENVLSRYYEAAKQFNAETVIRITSDCPVIDPALLDEMISDYLSSKTGYLSNSLLRTYPRGLDAEIFSFNVLEKTYKEAEKNYELEHVTPYIYKHPELFSLRNFATDVDFSFYRWTLDTEEDYTLIKEIYENLYTEGKIFLWKDILKLFELKPELIEINRHIEQKKLNG